MIDEALVGRFPPAPLGARIGRRDRTFAVRHRVGRVRDVIAARLADRRRIEAQTPIGAQIQAGRGRALGRPIGVILPHVRSRLQDARAVIGLGAGAVQPIAEERRLDLLAKLDARVAAERDVAEHVHLALPTAMRPWPGHHRAQMIGVVLLLLGVDLPRSPRVFLIPEASHVERRHGRLAERLLPILIGVETVVVRMVEQRRRHRDLALEIAFVEALERADP